MYTDARGHACGTRLIHSALADGGGGGDGGGSLDGQAAGIFRVCVRTRETENICVSLCHCVTAAVLILTYNQQSRSRQSSSEPLTRPTDHREVGECRNASERDALSPVHGLSTSQCHTVNIHDVETRVISTTRHIRGYKTPLQPCAKEPKASTRPQCTGSPGPLGANKI
jgi:hypothetical protein